MVEKDVTVRSNGTSLSGTACVPDGAGRVASVLMIHGTGPLDRDENMAGQRLDVFNTIAHSLAAAGIASFRYDKRGCGRSSGDYYRAGHADLVADAINCVEALMQFDFCDAGKVFVLGHSEGCLIAPQVSAKCPTVAGLVLVCPFVDTIESILIKQATRIEHEFDALPGVGGYARRWLARAMGMTVSSQRRLIHTLRTSRAEAMRIRFQKVPAKALRELLALDPLAIFRGVNVPTLLIGGEKDIQCDPADVARIANVINGPVSSHVVPDLTHVLRRDMGPPSFLGAGALLQKPVDPVVLQLIAAWLRERVRQA